ncbi:hypothetical protein Taro_024985 [Colocasia esculenta]|uniref:Transmembrane protein n=1 Tax=Colocasia esculenta TaxID=4460 RepID=A0A843VG68_COLES|nr:hypothetical protein [Colocasia esculenta]
MADWGAVFVSTVLFILLTPGLLFQVPGHCRYVEFGSLQTSGASILIHSVIYFSLVALFLVALNIHVYFFK